MSSYINEVMAMQLYTGYLTDYTTLKKEHYFGFGPIFNPYFHKFFNYLLGKGSMAIVNTLLLMEILENSNESLELNISSRELEQLLEQYKNNKYYHYKKIKLLVQPFIDRIEALILTSENLIVSAGFCKAHFDVEEVYNNILDELLD